MVIKSSSRPASISPSSEPNIFELPKDLSFLDIHQPSLPTAEDVLRQRAASALELASGRANEIQKRLQQETVKPQCPVVHEACRCALANELSKALAQTSLLLEDVKQEDEEACRMTKNKRLSLSLIKAVQYLDTLETAMAFSSRDRLEAGLLSVLNSIAAKCKDDLDTLNNVDESLDVCVSSWAAPSLAFDFRVGRPALLSLPAINHEPLSLPIELEVRSIYEYTADELIKVPGQKAEVFSVQIKKCRHERRENRGRGAQDGVTGQAMVQVHIEPLAESKNKKEVVWGSSAGVEPVRIKEVRATQQNANPTKLKINFDMYASTVYGQGGVTLTFALETFQTMQDVPKIKIELVVDP